jgi:hypothetical protein
MNLSTSANGPHLSHLIAFWHNSPQSPLFVPMNSTLHAHSQNHPYPSTAPLSSLTCGWRRCTPCRGGGCRSWLASTRADVVLAADQVGFSLSIYLLLGHQFLAIVLTRPRRDARTHKPCSATVANCKLSPQEKQSRSSNCRVATAASILQYVIRLAYTCSPTTLTIGMQRITSRRPPKLPCPRRVTPWSQWSTPVRPLPAIPP